jgi:hypothetical protein
MVTCEVRFYIIRNRQISAHRAIELKQIIFFTIGRLAGRYAKVTRRENVQIRYHGSRSIFLLIFEPTSTHWAVPVRLPSFNFTITAIIWISCRHIILKSTHRRSIQIGIAENSGVIKTYK